MHGKHSDSTSSGSTYFWQYTLPEMMRAKGPEQPQGIPCGCFRNSQQQILNHNVAAAQEA